MHNHEHDHVELNKRSLIVIKADSYPLGLRAAVSAFESQYIVAVLHRFGGNISLASKQLGIARRSLQMRIRALDLDVKQIRETSRKRVEEIMQRDEFAASGLASPSET